MAEESSRSMRPVDAATMVVWRRRRGTLEVLMGRRHHNHVFMPRAYVFPGGRVDPADKTLRAETDLRADVQARLERAANPTRARAIAAAAVRETWEETGLAIGTVDDGVLRPRLDGLDYFFRAITPPGRTRRFDARFFLAEANGATGALTGDGELVDVAFRSFDDSRLLDVAGITRIALAEAERHILKPPKPDPDRPVPLSRFLRGQYYITPE
ncbi:MAG: NUDIX hydrolase [Alphaproteobacteria bacterium]|nr:NUDIX hydrolase [Alphaproteobacteria bacterium]